MKIFFFSCIMLIIVMFEVKQFAKAVGHRCGWCKNLWTSINSCRVCNSGMAKVSKFRYTGRSLTGNLFGLFWRMHNNLLFSVINFFKWTLLVFPIHRFQCRTKYADIQMQSKYFFKYNHWQLVSYFIKYSNIFQQLTINDINVVWPSNLVSMSSTFMYCI